MTALTKLFRTTTFRLSLTYLALFGAAAAVAIFYIYWNTTVLLTRQLHDTIDAELKGLAEQYAAGGLTRLVRTVADRSQTPGNSLYFVADPDGRRVAGNLEASRGEAVLRRGNLFAALPRRQDEEQVDLLVEKAGLRIERIVSTGQSSPPGFWYDQPEDEFVVLLAGAARLRFEEGDVSIDMKPGDWVEIAAHVRHRVESTQAEPPAVWLAVHYQRGLGRTRAVGSAISGSSGQ